MDQVDPRAEAVRQLQANSDRYWELMNRHSSAPLLVVLLILGTLVAVINILSLLATK